MLRFELVPQEDWKHMSSGAHSLVFKESRTPEQDRADGAVVITDDGKFVGFVTVMELDNKTAYLQFGGLDDDYKATFAGAKAYVRAIDIVREKYEHLYLKTSNQNVRHIKMAMAAGFRIIGISNLRNEGELFLDMYLKGV